MVVCPCPGAIYIFEIVKNCKISLPVHDQVAGERYRTVGPLVCKFVTLFSGPTRETEANEFWEIIYQANVSLIIMFQEVNTKEKVIFLVKCGCLCR